MSEHIGIPKVFQQQKVSKSDMETFRQVDQGKLNLFFGDFDRAVGAMSKLFIALEERDAPSIKMLSFASIFENWRRGIDPEALEQRRADMVRIGWLGLYYINDDCTRVILQGTDNFLFWFRTTLENRVMSGKFTIIALSKRLDVDVSLAKIFGVDNLLSTRLKRFHF